MERSAGSAERSAGSAGSTGSAVKVRVKVSVKDSTRFPVDPMDHGNVYILKSV